MQCNRALGLKVSSALVLHTGNVEMFLSGLPLRVGDQPLPLCTPTLLGRTPTRHPELLSTAFPGKDLGQLYQQGFGLLPCRVQASALSSLLALDIFFDRRF